MEVQVPQYEYGNMSTAVREAEITADLFAGASEMHERCRAADWRATPLGPVSAWSQSLRTTVSTMLASRHPMLLWWGPELVQIFNDGYLPSFGTTGRGVAALGACGREHWAEIWDVIGPQIEGVMTRGEATWHEDQLIPIERNGRIEQVYWTYGYSPVRGDDGIIAGVLVVVQETTARVQMLAARERLDTAEHQARADADAARETMARVFAQAPVAIAVIEGRDLRYSVANTRYRQIVGDRDPVGKTLVEMFPGLAGSDIERVLEGVYENAVPFVANDLLVRFNSRGTGQIDNYYDLVYHPLTTKEGAVSGIVVIAVDVTDRRGATVERERLLREAEIARADAELANRAKSDFLAAMSHELRTPLNAIAGYAQLIELGLYGPVTDAQRTALVRIQNSERHLLSLVEDVLNFAKLEAGHVEYEVTEFALAGVIADVLPMIEPQLRVKGVHYEECIAPDLIVCADREKLQQILLNLLSNAIKFTEKGGHISVDTGQRKMGPLAGPLNESFEAPVGVVYLRVSDTGVGVLRDKQDEIFKPFVQLRSLTHSTGGTGLGLAISRDLARGMGGDLRVRSTLGEGSTFTLTLPAT